MSAPVVASCWICEGEPAERRCGGWGCWSAEAPVLSLEKLLSLPRPRLCIGCEQEPALIGNASNYCEGCGPHGEKFLREPTEREQAEHEMLEQSAFEQEERWGSGLGKHGDGTQTTDYSGRIE